MSRIDEIRERHLPGSSAGSGPCFECAVRPYTPELCDVTQVLAALDAAEKRIAELTEVLCLSTAEVDRLRDLRLRSHDRPLRPPGLTGEK
jgi:hypothetical protein